MRGKRSKQYRKLMQQYGITFGFREPYQVVLDADIIKDAGRFKMDLVGGLEKALHGKVKPSMSSPLCSMRHLYKADPPVPDLIEQAKTYERRRCNHHTLDEPLSTLECLSSIVDPNGSGTNKHRYAVASQVDEVRTFMRRIPGVPLVYIRRSVMILEPMAGVTEDVKEREERRKFRSALTGNAPTSGPAKMKRPGDRPEDTAGEANSTDLVLGSDTLLGDRSIARESKKRKRKGPKGPNPLSVKKPKKRVTRDTRAEASGKQDKMPDAPHADMADQSLEMNEERPPEPPAKKRRKRKHGTHANQAVKDLEPVSSPPEAVLQD